MVEALEEEAEQFKFPPEHILFVLSKKRNIVTVALANVVVV